MSRMPAPSPPRARPSATGKAIIGGGTTLGTPLKTRTVIGIDEPAPRAAAAATPTRRPVASSSSSMAFGSPAAASRTPARTPLKATGASAASSSTRAGPASSPPPAAKTSPRMISRQRYDTQKTSDPFTSGNKKFKTSFSEAYVGGRIPCRINHGSVRHTLQWDRPSHELDYAWLLPVICDGLIETEHPYCVIARQAFRELLAEGGQAKLAPVLPRLIQPLRRALMDAAPGVFVAACDAVIALAQVAGPLLNEHLDLLVQQVNKKALVAKLAEKVNETIMALAENGGDAAAVIIKKRVPAFTCQ